MYKHFRRRCSSDTTKGCIGSCAQCAVLATAAIGNSGNGRYCVQLSRSVGRSLYLVKSASSLQRPVKQGNQKLLFSIKGLDQHYEHGEGPAETVRRVRLDCKRKKFQLRNSKQSLP